MKLSKCEVLPRCDQMVPPGMVVCGRHADELALELLGAGSLADALEDAIAKAQRFSSSITGLGNPDESPVPFNSRASRARDELITYLREAADYIAAERELFRPLDTPKALGHWLAAQVPWMRSRHDGAEMVDHLFAVLHTAAITVDRPPDRLYLGRCVGTVQLEDGGEQPCTEELYSVPTRPEFTCRKCGWVYTIAERRARLLGLAAGLQLGATDCARALVGLGLDVTPSRVREYASRGLIDPVRDDAGQDVRVKGRPVYRVADVLAVVERIAHERGRDTSVVDSLRRMVTGQAAG